MNKAAGFKSPPKTLTPEGDERKVGFELEFTGVEMDEAAAILQSLYGGSVSKLSTYQFEVKESRFGTFKLELDAQILRDKKYEKLLRTMGVNVSGIKNIESIEDLMKTFASSVVPFEIVTPPIPLSSMNQMNSLVDELRRRKVKGTGSSFVYAFGLHLNPEAADLSAESILNHLRAYVMLDPWIRRDGKINMSRKITPFINEYEEKYILHILDPGYAPSIETLIVDYFRFGNSRNRPLDLLPLFMHINKELTSSLIEEKITSSRPTYHYRLPNCSLEDVNWTLAGEWNRWVLVEIMAADEKMLNRYSRAWLRLKRETLVGFENKWIELINRWVNEID
jgi:hypothetical protein